MTIIEVMVAILIGLFLSGAVVAAFVTTGRHYAQDEQVGRMQESARFALRFLSEDLTLIDFWGYLLDPAEINTSVRACEGSDTPECIGFFVNSTLSIASDCQPTTAPDDEPWAFDVSKPIEVVLQAADGTAANTAFRCIDEGEFEPDTDILSIKHVRGESLSSQRNVADDNGSVFMRTNGETGMLHIYNNAANASLIQGSNITDWQYMASLYYIRRDSLVGGSDSVPTLYRRTLAKDEISGAPTMQIEDGGIARGIEFFRVLFGIDLDNDGTPNTYTSNPTEAELAQAVTARIYVLARSSEPDYSYQNTKTYQLGDVIISGGSDHFYRRVFSTTVKLRNPSNMLRLQLDL